MEVNKAMNAIVEAYMLDNDRDTAVKIEQHGYEHWLPRSQIMHISIKPADSLGQIPCTITMQVWLANKKNLDYETN